MAKTDLILKKAAFFEKLALYGDKKSFLKAVGQNASMDILHFRNTKYSGAMSQLNKLSQILSGAQVPGIYGTNFNAQTSVEEAQAQINKIQRVIRSLNDKNLYAKAIRAITDITDVIDEYKKKIEKYRQQIPVDPDYPEAPDFTIAPEEELITWEGLKTPDLPELEPKTPTSKRSLFDWYKSQLQNAINKPDLNMIIKYMPLLKNEISKNTAGLGFKELYDANTLIEQAEKTIGM